MPFDVGVLLKLGLALALVYALVIAALYFTQSGLLFPESLARRYGLPPPAGAEPLSLRTGDGHELAGFLFRANPKADPPLLIAFGGNAQNAQELGAYLAEVLHGYDVAVFHYRGYYPSTGDPSERALLADALLVHDHLVGRLGPPAVYGIGVSLGSSVAAYLSKERPLDGLVLITPFDSIEAVAGELYFWAPVRLLLRHRFRSDLFMAGNPTPAAIIAAGRDKVVPPRRTAALAAVIDNLVFERTLPEAEHAVPLDDPEFIAALRHALAAVAGATRGRGSKPPAPSPLPAPEAQPSPASG